MSTAALAARIDVLAAAVHALAATLPDEAARAAARVLQAELGTLKPLTPGADAAAAGELASVLRALAGHQRLDLTGATISRHGA